MKKLWSHIARLFAAFGMMLLGLIPCYYKRVLFMTTVYVYYAREGIFHEVTASKFNEDMDLVKYDECLEAPFMFGDKVWEGKDLFKSIDRTIIQKLRQKVPLSQQQSEEIGTIIYRVTPKWLRYPKQDMANDLKRLLENPVTA